jgi:hypothetical protein
MDRWRYVSECDTRPPHLPPVDACALLTQDSRGIVRPIERFETPVDDNGIPNPYETLRLLASTLDSGYILPMQTNVHHQVHYRSEYQETTEKAYRDSPSLMMNMSVQMHNLNHELLLRAPKPPHRTMEQYNIEQQAISTLFKFGSAALHAERQADNLSDRLGGLAFTDLAIATDGIAQLRRKARTKRKLYEKVLQKLDAGPLDLLPDPAMLSDMGLSDATTYLGKIGGNGFLDFRRASQEFIKSYGIEQSSSIAETTIADAA